MKIERKTIQKALPVKFEDFAEENDLTLETTEQRQDSYFPPYSCVFKNVEVKDDDPHL